MRDKNRAPEFYHIGLDPINGIITTNIESGELNMTAAIYSRWKKVLVIHPSYKEFESDIFATLPKLYQGEIIKTISGCEFRVDTHDGKIAEL